MPKAAAIYARISEDRDGDQLGVKRQLQDCYRLAEQKGWTVAEPPYVDDDISAYSGKHRPRYRAMLADIKDGIRDGLIVYDLDRLIRRSKELEEFFEICDAAGLREFASVTGDIDLGTEDGRFVARIRGAVAQKESADKSRRIRRKMLELAQDGKYKGGRRGYGFTKDGTALVPEEAALIAECAERFLAGDTLVGLARELNGRGVLSAEGHLWAAPTIRLILRSARIAGLREHHGDIVAKAQWPAIITPEQSARIRAILDDPARRTNRSARTYLLTGVLRCGRCGARLFSGTTNNGTRRYGCIHHPDRPACSGISIKAETLEEFVTEAVFARLESPEFAASLAGQVPQEDLADSVQADLDADQVQLDELATTYAAKQISLREWLRARDPIEARIAATRRRLRHRNGTAAIEAFIDDAGALPAQWPQMSLARQQAIVRAMLDDIVILPGVKGRRAFDAARVKPSWRL